MHTHTLSVTRASETGSYLECDLLKIRVATGFVFELAAHILCEQRLRRVAAV